MICTVVEICSLSFMVGSVLIFEPSADRNFSFFYTWPEYCYFRAGLTGQIVFSLLVPAGKWKNIMLEATSTFYGTIAFGFYMRVPIQMDYLS